MDISFVEAIGKLVGDYGLPITSGIIIIGAFVWILKKTFQNHEQDRKTWIETLQTKEVQLSNHLEHLERAFLEHDSNLTLHNQSFENGVEKIVDAINNQTNLLERKNGGRDE